MNVRKSKLYRRKEKRYRKKNFPMHKADLAISRLASNDRDKLRRLHNDHKLHVGIREMHISRPNDDWLIRYSKRKDGGIDLLDMNSHDEMK